MPTKQSKKAQLINNVLKQTKGSPEKYFDQLADKSEEYLGKLLQVTKLLK